MPKFTLDNERILIEHKVQNWSSMNSEQLLHICSIIILCIRICIEFVVVLILNVVIRIIRLARTETWFKKWLLIYLSLIVSFIECTVVTMIVIKVIHAVVSLLLRKMPWKHRHIWFAWIAKMQFVVCSGNNKGKWGILWNTIYHLLVSLHTSFW